ncbi:MAG: aminotransferase class V-fold PLP-dependent enzyme [Thiohalocapsa sp.]
MQIYLDNNAATPVDPRVLAAFTAATAHPGNPQSSEHALGRSANARIETAADAVAALIDAQPNHVTFLPGATAALTLLIDTYHHATQEATFCAGAADHSAVLKRLRDLAQEGAAFWLAPVDNKGHLRLDTFETLVHAHTPRLVCLVAANNEVGTIDDLAPACRIAQEAGAIVMVDACQAAGKIPLSFQSLRCDFLVLSGAKLYGLPRTAAVVSRYDLSEAAKSRFGSPDAPGAVSLGEACRLRAEEMNKDEARIASLRDRLENILCSAFPDMHVNGDPARRLAGILNFAVPGVPNDAVLARVDGRIALSSGAACQSGAQGPSHVLRAMNAPDWVLDGALRVGVGKFNTATEIQEAGSILIAAIEEARTACYRRSA